MAMQTASMLSLDEDADGQRGPHDVLSFRESVDPADDAARRELLARMADEIRGLPERERRVLVLYYGDGLFLKEIGAVLGVTESRVSQIHGRAVWRLARAMSVPVSQE